MEGKKVDQGALSWESGTSAHSFSKAKQIDQMGRPGVFRQPTLLDRPGL